MKRAIILILILLLINPPLWATQGLAPTNGDWREDKTENILAVAPLFFNLRTDEIQKDTIDRQLRAINVVPYWSTLLFNPDESIEIVMDYRDTKGKSNFVINRFVRTEDGKYYVEIIKDGPRVDNRIVRGILGLNFSNVIVPAGVLEEVKRVSLSQAYAITEEEPIQEVLGIVNQARERVGASVKVVVVLGREGSLIDRAVVQMLGSEEVRFIFPDNIVNPSRWLAELKGINPENVLLYVSSKPGSTDETMANFCFFWEWLIRNIGQPNIANSLIQKLQNVNLSKVNLLNKLELSKEEKVLLQNTLNRIVVTTTIGEQGALCFFAVNNNIPIVPLQTSILFINALAGYDIENMRLAVLPFASAFKENNPGLNPALETAMYAYASYISGKPILAMVSSNEKVTPLFEWSRQLVDEGLGKSEKGPYLAFATGAKQAQDLMKAPKDKLFLVVNVGEERLEIPEGVAAIEINIPEINAENLARLFLFLEEFTVRYETLLGVNPTNQLWINKFEQILTESANGFDTSQKARQRRQEEADAVEELVVKGGLSIPKALNILLSKLTESDQELQVSIPVKVPENESGFNGLLDVGNYRLPGKLEEIARNLALQIYAAEKMGKSINPFFIYSASPEARLIGEFIKLLGQKRMARLKGGVLWDYLIGTTDQSIAQFLGEGTDIVITTFMHFLQEPEKNPPIISANGLIDERLNGKIPKEINTLYLEAVREALNNEGRITNTVEVPNEGGENLAKLYQLLVRTSELYSRLWEYENKGGDTFRGLVSGNESVRIMPEAGVSAGGYDRELPREPMDLYGITVPMHIGGVATKGFIHPQVEGISGEVASGVDRFMSRVNVLARVVSRVSDKKGSALNRFVTTDELKEKAKEEFYAFKLEDVIAKVEVGSEVGDTLWEEIRIKSANTMIAKTIQEIKRINPKAKVIVYTENPRLTERRIETALDAIESGSAFDLIVCGNANSVLAKVVDFGWAKSLTDASQKTIFASSREMEGLKSVVVSNKRFVPFPELTLVMQEMLRTNSEDGRLVPETIDRIVESYYVWLELAGFNREEIVPYIDELRKNLANGMNFIVTLPIPPLPKAGSVMQLLDKEYEEATNTKGFA